MRVLPARRSARPFAGQRRVIGPFSPEFGMAGILRQVSPSAGQAWASANDPLALPFRLNESVLVTRLGWVNGSTVTTSNFDIGIYDSAWTRIVSAGSTARSGASAWQWVDVADTRIGPGSYYLVGSADNTNVSRVFGWGMTSAAAAALLGANDSATDAFPLPDPLTNMAAASVASVIPIMGIECATTVSPLSASGQLVRIPKVWVPESLYDNPFGTATGSLHTNTVANQAQYYPCYFPVACTLTSLSFAGNNTTGNYDLGLYDASFRKIASTGSTAMSVAVQTLSLSDYRVEAGTVLYAALSVSTVSSRYIGLSMSSLPGVIMSGCAEEASALPLPSTGTPVTPANATHLSIFSFGVR